MRYYYTPTRRARIQKIDNTPSIADDTEKLENSNISAENIKWYSLFGKQLVVSFKYTLSEQTGNFTPIDLVIRPHKDKITQN